MTQKISTVFLDIDGLLADFDTHLVTHNKFKADGSMDRDALDHQWWSTIPVFEGARAFYDSIKSRNKDVKFLTGPMLSVDCFSGKATWISDVFLADRGKWALTDLIICHSKRKNLMAAPDRILVDDMIENVESWREAGGIAIHHQGDFAQTMAELNKYLPPAKKPTKDRSPKLKR